jgi:hypothetical protein
VIPLPRTKQVTQDGKMTPQEGTQLVNMYTYMHMSVDQQVTKITDIYATVTTYDTFGQSKISIKTKSEYD